MKANELTIGDKFKLFENKYSFLNYYHENDKKLARVINLKTGNIASLEVFGEQFRIIDFQRTVSVYGRVLVTPVDIGLVSKMISLSIPMITLISVGFAIYHYEIL